MNILVVGGAGYVGSHMVARLLDSEHHVTVLDDLSSGHKSSIADAKFIEGCIGDRQLLDSIFSESKFDAVFHFAAFIEVGESVADPSKYYRNNCSRTFVLLDAMVAHKIDKFIFSSTAAVFGEPEYTPIDEAHPRSPINPYGRTKLIVEQALEDYEQAYGLHSICLRYFNAAGAHPSGKIGEMHDPESHLIPLILQAASGRRDSIYVFGEDYDTHDGSCVRDYVHVCDLAEAHLLALNYLEKNNKSGRFNLGNGNGFSVKEVIETAKEISGVDFNVQIVGRREGDPARLVADPASAMSELGWTPNYAELSSIVKNAWRWEKTLVAEYDKK